MKKSEKPLLEAALGAAALAYAPYSRFQVGAALEAEDGRIFTGCNVENASYGLTVCAERVAVFAGVAAGCRRFRRIAIAAGTGSEPATPCGACRQVLAEFARPGFEVLLVTLDNPKSFRRFTLTDLLPHAFKSPWA
jgi:cytidine deaminase